VILRIRLSCDVTLPSSCHDYIIYSTWDWQKCVYLTPHTEAHIKLWELVNLRTRPRHSARVFCNYGGGGGNGLVTLCMLSESHDVNNVSCYQAVAGWLLGAVLSLSLSLSPSLSALGAAPQCLSPTVTRDEETARVSDRPPIHVRCFLDSFSTSFLFFKTSPPPPAPDLNSRPRRVSQWQRGARAERGAALDSFSSTLPVQEAGVCYSNILRPTLPSPPPTLFLVEDILNLPEPSSAISLCVFVEADRFSHSLSETLRHLLIPPAADPERVILFFSCALYFIGPFWSSRLWFPPPPKKKSTQIWKMIFDNGWHHFLNILGGPEAAARWRTAAILGVTLLPAPSIGKVLEERPLDLGVSIGLNQKLAATGRGYRASSGHAPSPFFSERGILRARIYFCLTQTFMSDFHQMSFTEERGRMQEHRRDEWGGGGGQKRSGGTKITHMLCASETEHMYVCQRESSVTPSGCSSHEWIPKLWVVF